MKEAEVALPGPSYCCALALTLGGGTPKAHEEPSPLVGAQGTTRKGKEKHRIHLTSSLRQNNVILYVFSFTGGELNHIYLVSLVTPSFQPVWCDVLAVKRAASAWWSSCSWSIPVKCFDSRPALANRSMSGFPGRNWSLEKLVVPAKQVGRLGDGWGPSSLDEG